MIETHAEIALRWPAVVTRAESAVGALSGDAGRLACRHVVDGAPPFASVCAEHPAAGLQCAQCARRHAARHSEEVESRCDHCGVQSALLHPLISLGQVVDLKVRDTGGRHRWLTGTLAVDCLGVCASCWAEAGMPPS